MVFDAPLPGTSKRRVALGGRSAAPESREALLARTRAEREERHRASRENVAATALQAGWRGRVGRVSAQAAVRDAWVASHGVGGEDVCSASFAPPSTTLSRLAFFASPVSDAPALVTTLSAARAAALTGLASSVGLTLPAAVALARAAADALWAHRGAWGGALAAPRGAPASPASALADFIVWVADPAAWADAADPSAAAAATLSAAVLPTRGALFDRAGGLLPPQETATPSIAAGLIGNAAARALGAGRSRPVLASAPLRALATAPDLWTRCPALAPLAGRLARAACEAVVQEAGGVLAWIAPSLTPGCAPPGGGGGAAAALLGNVSAAAPALASSPAAARSLCAAGPALLAACPPSCGGLGEVVPLAGAGGAGGATAAAEASDEEGEEEDGMDLDAAPSTSASSWLPWSGPPDAAVSSVTAAQVATLAGPAVLGPLLRAALAEDGEEEGATSAPAFLAALASRKGLRSRALAALAATGAAPLLWGRVVKPLALAGGVGEEGEGPPLAPAAVAALLPALAILAPTLSTSLAASASSSSSSSSSGLPPSALGGLAEAELTPLIRVCVAVLTHLLWSAPPPVAAPALGRAPLPPVPFSTSTRDAALAGTAALLRALHDRAGPDGGPALPPDLFEAPPAALPPARFRAEVASTPPTQRSAAVLRAAPFLVPFRDRVAAFTDALGEDAEEDWNGGLWGAHGGGGPAPPRFAVIRRTAVLTDALASLAPLPARTLATGRIRIQFVDEHGLEEAGIDGGGLWKEAANLIVLAAFSPSGSGGDSAGLFAETPARELYPDPAAVSAAVAAALAGGPAASGVVSLPTFEFLGRLLGRLARDGLASGVPLAPFITKQLLGRPVGLADLPSLDPALADSLAALRSAPPGTVAAAGLTFTASDAAGGEVPLHPGGASRAVTGENVVEFVLRAAHHYLTGRLAPAIDALRRGLAATLPPGWGSAFGAAEFGALLGGSASATASSSSLPPLDVADMKAHVRYGGGYGPDHPAVEAFWEAVEEMTPAEQASVLRFVTAAGRPPLLGFSRLAPPLTIVPAGGGGKDGAQTRLPSAATCMNLLKLPDYGRRGGAGVVKERLLYAAREAGGFGLS